MNKWLWRIITFLLTPIFAIGLMLIMPVFLVFGFWESLREDMFGG